MKNEKYNFEDDKTFFLVTIGTLVLIGMFFFGFWVGAESVACNETKIIRSI